MSVWSFTRKYWKPGSAGFKMEGLTYEICDKNELGHGEICFLSRNVFMGYLGEEGKTKDATDDQFRLRSGDIGVVDGDGFLFITGRIKGDQLITLYSKSLGLWSFNTIPEPYIFKQPCEPEIVANC